MIPPYNLAVLDDAITRLPTEIAGRRIEYRVHGTGKDFGPYVHIGVHYGDGRLIGCARHATDDRITDFEDAFRKSMFSAVVILFAAAMLNIDPVYVAFGHPVPPDQISDIDAETERERSLDDRETARLRERADHEKNGNW